MTEISAAKGGKGFVATRPRSNVRGVKVVSRKERTKNKIHLIERIVSYEKTKKSIPKAL